MESRTAAVCCLLMAVFWIELIRGCRPVQSAIIIFSGSFSPDILLLSRKNEAIVPVISTNGIAVSCTVLVEFRC